MPRSTTIGVAVLLLALIGCQDSGGCGTDYNYPRTDPAAAPSLRALRLRVTQTGLDSIARAFPGLVASACAANVDDGTAPCALLAPGSDRVKFYLGTTAAPLAFDLSLTRGQVRPQSTVTIDTQSLRGNVHLSLVNVVGGRDGIQVTLGCNAPNFASCTNPSAFVDAAVDMVVFVEGFSLLVTSYNDSACFVQDDAPPAPGIVIQQLRFTIYPHVDAGADGKPYLILDDQDVIVDRMEVSLDVQAGRACWDPVCNACGAGGDCDLCDDLSVLTSYVIEPLIETGPVAKYLSAVIARQLVKKFADQPLEVTGAINVGERLNVANNAAHDTGYLIGANVDSPDVTGGAGDLGMNFDFDTGFAARHSPCVPALEPPAWLLPATPDPGGTVMAPDPTTGVLRPEPFDLALIAGDVVANRATFELFDAGSFCFHLQAEEVAGLSNGSFVPTVGAVSVVAPGLASLAPVDAPVTLGTQPYMPTFVSFGTGDGEGPARDSHLRVVWPQFTLEIMPLVDDAFIRALAMTSDFEIGLSLEPTPTGDLQIMIDNIALNNLSASYNEIPIQFDVDGVGRLVEALVPRLLNGDPFNVPLTATTLGFPFVPKVRAVTALDLQKRFLGVFIRFCSDEDLHDAANPLCFDPAAGAGRAPSARRLELQRLPLGSPGRADAVGVRALANAWDPAALQIAYRVDGKGPFFGFRGPRADGVFVVTHPALAAPGWHEIEAIGRSRQLKNQWTEPTTLAVLVDDASTPSPPAVAPSVAAPVPSSPPYGDGCRAVPTGGLCLVLLASLWTFAGARQSARHRR
ncbi:MAG: hypothetical protein HY903_15310 [Deltaproteobacteria bacterium]|nr:hypothetical protein [Deltaproteobacteria bacterium]